MKTLTLKIIFGLAVLFGLGICTGLVLARPGVSAVQTDSPVRGNFKERWMNARIAEYANRLNLTSEQVSAMRPHFESALTEMEHVHNDVRARITTAIKDLNAQISEVMTPEQRQEFRRLLKEKSRRRQANGGAD